MDRFKNTELSTPGFGKAKKSASPIGPPTGQPRTISEDEQIVSYVGGSKRTPANLSFGKSSNPIGGLRTEQSSSSSGTFPQMRKKTDGAMKSVSPLRATKSGNTPGVRFAQQKSATVPRPSPLINVIQGQNVHPSVSFAARKASSNSPFRKQVTASLQPPPFSVKTARPFLPLWQHLDEEHERATKRKRDVRRISSTGQSRVNVGRIADQIRDKAHIAPKLHLRLDGEIDLSSTEDENDTPRRQLPIKIATKTTGGHQFAVKKSAARTIEFVDVATNDEVSEGGSTMDEEDQLLPEEYDLPSNQLGEQHAPLRPSTVFNPAPQITIALPQVKAEPEDDRPVGELGPPEELVKAVEALTIGPIRMQATRQLPFLRRNLRQGFIRRCADVLIPIHPDQKLVSLEVAYEYVDGIVFQAKVEDWLCPLCNLFGKFTTQATLYCHLKWDHGEILSDWEKLDESDVRENWRLQVMIAQEVGDDGQPRLNLQDEAEDEKEQDEEEDDAGIPDDDVPGSPSIPASGFSSPFPSVSLSPLSAPQREQNVTSPDMPKIKHSQETPQPPISRSISILQPSLSRSRSTTGNTTATTTTIATPRPRDARYPTPPPPDDPLGPAARPPYLPAYSEYGGPAVYYSCRPGGACLFDLLGTLPMQQFGLLEWEVIDREEEIYERDDVKEEYKVMHALWARWIMLHRNDFISDFYQGTLAFVDYYWRMIHRAAGWDALRYWLLILLANQFLNAQEVAQVLIHYEGLIGMASWCDSL